MSAAPLNKDMHGARDDPDTLARHYAFTRSDQDLVAGCRGAANRLGFAVQLALLPSWHGPGANRGVDRRPRRVVVAPVSVLMASSAIKGVRVELQHSPAGPDHHLSLALAATWTRSTGRSGRLMPTAAWGAWQYDQGIFGIGHLTAMTISAAIPAGLAISTARAGEATDRRQDDLYHVHQLRRGGPARDVLVKTLHPGK